jgi:hypothetical protein
MSAVTRPRGPLPRRVYWFRRVLVLAVAFGLVFGIARLLGATAGDDSERAAQVAAPQAPTSGAATPTPSADQQEDAEDAAGQDTAEKAKARAKKKRKRLPQPNGPCLESDVVVTPLVRTQPAGQRVRIVLQVGTLEAPACYWEVTPDSVFVTIASDDLGLLWTTQHCREAVPTADVVARKEKPARVAFFWDGRESDEECSGAGPWVTSGDYLAEAAARGSTEVQEAVFVLGPAATPTITKTPTPTQTPAPTARPKQSRGTDGGDNGDNGGDDRE